MLRILIIIFALDLWSSLLTLGRVGASSTLLSLNHSLASTVTVDAQNEVVGGCVKKGGTESGINATSRFPMYSVMKFPQALYVADFLIRNNIDLNTEVMIRKDELLQDT